MSIMAKPYVELSLYHGNRLDSAVSLPVYIHNRMAEQRPAPHLHIWLDCSSDNDWAHVCS